ncbi:MAG: tail fiber domain-containing protein [Chloroflexi bacterium]|nr:tail fiber domain-containing protein [Chloroflexota bacterium]
MTTERTIIAILVAFILGVLFTATPVGGSVLDPIQSVLRPSASPGPAPVNLMNFQGELTDPSTGDPVADGTYSIRFSVWDADAAGSEEWNETQPAVSVSGGLFSVLLGSVTPLTADVFGESPRYLEIEIDPAGAAEVLSPRQQFATVPYAFHAVNAWALDGNSGTGAGTNFLGTTDNADLAIRTNGIERMHFDTNGNVGIGTSSPGSALEIRDDTAPQLSVGHETFPQYAVEIHHSGIINAQNGANGNLTLKNDGVTAITISNAANVGIGTTSPTRPLTVVRPDGADSGDFMASFTNNDTTSDQGHGLLIQAGNDSADIPLMVKDLAGLTLLRVIGNGNVGIGTTSPTEKLHVVGNVIVSGLITGDLVCTECVGTTELKNGNVETVDLANNSITTLKIVDGAVDTPDLATNAVTAAKVAFNYAGSTSEGGAATDLSCANCVSAGEVAFNYAGSASENGPASDLVCVACVDSSEIVGALAGWLLGGNAGTTPGTDFVGTTDNVALELRVNGARAMRLEPNGTSPNLIGGFGGNSVTAGKVGATIGGGGASGFENQVTGNFSTVGGGRNNTASAQSSATVGGGSSNTASGNGATVGGGSSNTVGGQTATIGGGFSNEASSIFATVGGGGANTASAFGATIAGGIESTSSGAFAAVPGGSLNAAAGDYSLAAGRRAKVAAAHDGTFLFADSSGFDFNSAAANEFAVRSIGGARVVTAVDGGTGAPTAGVKLDPGDTAWEVLSDRESKENFVVLNARAILERLSGVPITEWNYKAQDASNRHIGPTAQDFYAAFGLSDDERYISPIDTDGVALAAIQGLYELAQEQQAQIAVLQEGLGEEPEGSTAAPVAASPTSSGLSTIWVGLGAGLFLAALVLGRLGAVALRRSRA